MKRLLFVDIPSAAVGRYYVEAAHRMGLGVDVAAKALPAGWERFDLRHHTVDLDAPEALDALVSLHGQYAYAGTLTYSEWYVPLAARFAAAAGLPAVPVAAAELTRHKWRLAQRLTEHGVIVPLTRFADSPAALLAAADGMAFPVVIKPVDGMGSVGVVRVESGADLARQIAMLADLPRGRFRNEGFLLQAYVAGPEVSVEGVVQHGTPHILAVTDKRLGAPPFFVEAGHTVPSALPAAERHQVQQAVTQTIAALGMDHCGFHAELKVTPGGPVLLEIAARLAGGFIPNLAYLATGVNLFEQTVRLCQGMTVQMAPRRQRAASVQFVMAPKPGVITGVQGVEDAGNAPGVVTAEVTLAHRQVVPAAESNFSNRLGLVMATGSTSDEVTARVLAAHRLIRLQVVPVDSLEGGDVA